MQSRTRGAYSLDGGREAVNHGAAAHGTTLLFSASASCHLNQQPTPRRLSYVVCILPDLPNIYREAMLG